MSLIFHLGSGKENNTSFKESGPVKGTVVLGPRLSTLDLSGQQSAGWTHGSTPPGL